ncbi:MAG TPA: hypothetical protein VFE50_17955 [Cyclobacteriaceae bacterium]|nr:hypothetical protein [Cyclobacteriaceae bacterium]
MTKSKKLAHKLSGWAQTIALVVGLVTLYVMMDQRLDQTDEKVDLIDRRLYRLEIKVDGIERRLDDIDRRLTKLENLVNLDLSWRYLYQNDPARKHLRPVYHPDTKTLELVPVGTTNPTTVRKP